MRFKYTAMDAQGKTREGYVDADSERGANIDLKNVGLFPMSISCVSGEEEQKFSKAFRIFGFEFRVTKL